jgi:hypothetical protein
VYCCPNSGRARFDHQADVPGGFISSPIAPIGLHVSLIAARYGPVSSARSHACSTWPYEDRYSIVQTKVGVNPFNASFGRPIVIDESRPAIAAPNKAILFGDLKSAYTARQVSGVSELSE